MSTYTMRATTALGYEDAVTCVRAALADEGFAILTEIDIQATLRDKLGVDVPRQLILGACRPQLAHRALQAAPSIGALLPCNVTVREVAEGGAIIEAIDPDVMTQLESGPALAGVASEARARLRAALDRTVLQEA